MATRPKHCILLLNLILCFVSTAKAESDVFLVLLKGSPVLHYDGSLADFPATASESGGRVNMSSQAAKQYASHLIEKHDSLLERCFEKGTYKKLYSYFYLVNGFAVWISSEQAQTLWRMPEVLLVEQDRGVQKLTTYTPSYLGLPNGAWAKEGGVDNAGEGIVIGFVDTGINPTHPSFSDRTSRPYQVATKYTGTCEVTTEFPEGSCNKKLVGARHFAAAAIAKGKFNATADFASPLDGDGHGTHTASTAAGNSGVPVVVAGMNFGLASGMAPRAHVAMYKALYRSFGGYFADTVAALDQAVQDGVDILSLSIGPLAPPSGLATFFSSFDIAALSAVKAGVFVAQAAGNSGPYPSSALSFSPWICSVAAALHDRSYNNSILLGNNQSISGLGLSPGTQGIGMYEMVTAADAQKKGSKPQFDLDSCQDPSDFDQTFVQGRILVCAYQFTFSVGLASIHTLLNTAKSLSAQGVVILTSRDTIEPDFTPVPSTLPAIVIPSLTDSLTLLQYYNTSTRFTATARILGGMNATFSNRAPQVAIYSSRGPDLATDKLAIADIMKPDVLAPGNMIWAGWSPIGVDADDFQGENFAMISGTSMATPHIAGIAALIKQKNLKFSPAAIASALTTTASVQDKDGNPILAQTPSTKLSDDIGPGTPYDFGGGAVNATAALDPGLVFDAGFDDYVDFLCSIPGSAAIVLNTTGATCSVSSPSALPTDLNTPSITVANLTATRSIPRTVTNVAAATESYTVTISEPDGVSVTIVPTQFSLGMDETQQLVITLIPTSTSGNPSFGSIGFAGSGGHFARIPISVAGRTRSG